MIYSAISSHAPLRNDEMIVTSGNVVAIRTVFDDAWAVATNITTGESGIVPLVCFVEGGVVPERVDSLDIGNDVEEV